MKKTVITIALIMIVFALTGCSQKVEGNYIKDKGIRYQTIMDAVLDKDGSDNSKLIVSLEVDGFVGVAYRDQQISRTTLYKDVKGFFPSNTMAKYGDIAVTNKSVGGFISWRNLEGKYCIKYDGLAFSEKEIKTVTDNYGNKFEYALGMKDDIYIYIYMLVLDELPEDYRVIINGEEYALPKETNTELIFAIVVLIVVLIIFLFNLKKIRRKLRARKYEKKFDDIYNLK